MKVELTGGGVVALAGSAAVVLGALWLVSKIPNLRALKREADAGFQVDVAAQLDRTIGELLRTARLPIGRVGEYVGVGGATPTYPAGGAVGGSGDPLHVGDYAGQQPYIAP